MPQNTHPKLAYLTGGYPKASHTFIQREIAALRVLGAEVVTTSIRRPDATDLIGSEEVQAKQETFYVLKTAQNPVHLLRAHLALLIKSPLRWLRAVGKAWQFRQPGIRGTLWHLFYFLEAGVLAHHLKKQGVQHLHNHFGDSSATVALLTSILADVPYSFTLHGPTEFFAPEHWKIGQKVKDSAFTVCITHFARSQTMIFSDPGDWDKLKIIHCGVDPDRYGGDAPQNQGSGLGLLFVGRLTPLKGLRILFEAFESLRATYPDLRLAVIGDGPDKAWADAEAARIGGISMMGYQSQSDVAKALSQADALVLPSFAEGLPVVFMEALAAATPVIASRVAGVGELVVDGETGLLVHAGDITSLTQALETMITQPEMRKRMGRVGQAIVAQEFNSQHEAARLLTLFDTQGGR